MTSTALAIAPRYSQGQFGSGPSVRDPYYAEVIKLREENEDLREQLRYVKELISPPGLIFPQRWRLTGKEATLLRALMAAVSITKERLLAALYDAEPEVEIKIVDVFVCKLRAKLARDGVKIDTIWGCGYKIDQRMKAVILDACESAKQGSDWASPLKEAQRPFDEGKRGSKGGNPLRHDKIYTGAELREQRLALNLSQIALANLAGLPSPCYVSSVESGTSIVKSHVLIERALRAERRKRCIEDPPHGGQ